MALSNLFDEVKVLRKNSKGAIFIIAFRISNYFSKNKFLRLIGFPIRLLYKISIQWILGIDIPDDTSIGFGFNVYHGQALIINSATIIGKNVTVRHCTTIGNSKKGGGSPIIKDNVEIGANSVIIGNIIIGEHSIIAAGTVVVKDVPPFVIVAGNPATIKKQVSQ